MWNKQKIKLLGHLLRADWKDPLHQATFTCVLKTPRQPIKRRKGRPRDQWAVETMKEAYEHLKLIEENTPIEHFIPLTMNNYTEIDYLENYAKQRIGMFATKPPKFNKNIFLTSNQKLDQKVNFVSEQDPYNVGNTIIIPASYYQFL